MLRSYKSSLLVLPAILLAGLYINTNVFADSNDVDFSITVNPSLTLALSSNTVNFSITPTAQGAYNSANFTVTSATNNAYGYTLVMGTSNVNLTSGTINPVTTEYPTIPTLTETQDGISAADFEASTDSTVLNHYGVAIGTGNNFNAMKTSNPIKKTNANNASGVDNTVITLASKLDLATVPGTYSTTINFQMTANPLPGGLEEAYQNAGKTKKTIGGKEYYAMQDMNSTICSNATVEDDQIQVYDNRDDKIYWIAKLKDGHCWMTQNLDHDIVTTANYYTNLNTDIGYNSATGVYDTASWTADYATHISSDTIWCDRQHYNYSFYVCDYFSIASYDPGELYWNGRIGNYSAGNEMSSVGDFHYHLGNYYNWGAAVATSDKSTLEEGTVDQSICPAGWTLPRVTSGENSFYNLLDQYGFTSDPIQGSDSMWSYPLYFGLSGALSSSSTPQIAGVGSRGDYWIATLDTMEENVGYAYDLYIVIDAGEPGHVFTDDVDGGPLNVGHSVRCVAR